MVNSLPRKLLGWRHLSRNFTAVLSQEEQKIFRVLKPAVQVVLFSNCKHIQGNIAQPLLHTEDRDAEAGT